MCDNVARARAWRENQRAPRPSSLKYTIKIIQYATRYCCVAWIQYDCSCATRGNGTKREMSSPPPSASPASVYVVFLVCVATVVVVSQPEDYPIQVQVSTLSESMEL